MDRLRAAAERIVAFFRRGSEEAELKAEVEHHLQMEIEANLRAGLDPKEARRRALVAFGGTDWQQERTRDERWGRSLEALARDLRHGVRNLRKRAAFTVAAVVTLSLGVGMSTTMFVLVDAVLLHPVAGANARGMVYLTLGSDDGRMTRSPTPELLRLLKEEATSFADVEAYTRERMDVWVDGEPLQIRGARASVGFFSFLGVGPALGRLFVEGDGAARSGPVVVLSHTFWTERMGGDRTAVGRTLRIGDRIHEVVGVLPADFRLDSPGIEFWIPEGGAGALFAEGTPVEGALLKLAPGVTVERAREEVAAIVANTPLARRPGMDVTWVPLLHEPAELVSPSLTRAVWMLQAGALLVLLVGCGNLTSLLLAQGDLRAREFAVRASLGAGRGRLVQQLLSESFLLGLLGGAGGILLTYWALEMLPAFLPAGYSGFAVSPGTMAFAAGVALFSVLGFGLLPAIRGSKRGLSEIIKGEHGLVAGRSRSVGVRQLLVAFEVAVTVVLLIGSGLLLKSFAGLATMETGIDAEDLLAFRIDLPPDRYESPETRAVFLTRLREEVATAISPALGEVSMASGLVSNLVGSFAPLSADGADVEGAEPVVHWVREVDPQFFSLVGLRILRGRGFTESDRLGGDNVVVVDETVARQFFGEVDPLGRGLQVGGESFRVLGVVQSIRLPSLVQEGYADLQLYRPFSAESALELTLLVRLRGDPAEAVSRLKEAVWRIDRDLPLQGIAMVEDQLAESLDQERSNATLMILFALTSLLLGAVGIYGVVAYAVRRRFREMAIRRALGASAQEVVRRLVLGGMAAVVVGLALGLAGAAALGATLSSLLFEVEPRDPAVYAAVMAMTLVVSLLATGLPAMGSARVRPNEVLRGD